MGFTALGGEASGRTTAAVDADLADALDTFGCTQLAGCVPADCAWWPLPTACSNRAVLI
jgi:hypothetical protein